MAATCSDKQKQYKGWNQERVLTQHSDVIFEDGKDAAQKHANNAIPIHLHLDKQTEDIRNDFSPFSLHLAY